MHILDVGCGPGTITIDFARLVSEGKVIGIDTSQDVLEKAQDTAKGHQIKNIEFQVGDVLALKFPDSTFDVVHAHQVLQYVADPVLALSEMRRVAKPGGVVAVREGDYLGSIIYPESPEIGYFWRDLYPRLMLATGGEPAAARKVGPEKLALRSHGLNLPQVRGVLALRKISLGGAIHGPNSLSHPPL